MTAHVTQHCPHACAKSQLVHVRDCVDTRVIANAQMQRWYPAPAVNLET